MGSVTDSNSFLDLTKQLPYFIYIPANLWIFLSSIFKLSNSVWERKHFWLAVGAAVHLVMHLKTPPCSNLDTFKKGYILQWCFSSAVKLYFETTGCFDPQFLVQRSEWSLTCFIGYDLFMDHPPSIYHMYNSITHFF